MVSGRKMYLGLLAVFVLLAASVLLAWWFSLAAARHEQAQQLERFVLQSQARVTNLLRGLEKTERELVELDMPLCSVAMRRRLRELVYDHQFVREVLVIHDERIHCSNMLSQLDQPVPLPRHDFIGRQGNRIWMPGSAPLAAHTEYLYVAFGQYIVAIHPSHLIDVVPDHPQRNLALLIAQEGGFHVLASWPQFPVRNGAAFNPQEPLPDWLAATSGDNFLQVVAVEPLVYIRKGAENYFVVLLVLFCAGFGAIAWWVRRWLQSRYSLLGVMDDAIENGEFVNYYQPIVDLASGRIAGAEALVRWAKPDGSLIRPDLFIPLAEESGKIRRITLQVLENLEQDLGELLRTRPELYVSINVTEPDLSDDIFFDALAAACAPGRLPVGQVRIELTERCLIDSDQGIARVVRLREAGHAIYIDDFGTGYSSLSYLQKFPLDVLKIDKAFVDTMDTEAVTGGVVPHIVGMASALGLNTLAEGIEQESQRAKLQAIGVQYGQGWLFGKPLPAERFIDKVNNE